MSCAPLDYVGRAGDPTTQGLGRLIGQYANSTRLITLLGGVYALGQDLEALFQRLSRLLNLNDNIYHKVGNDYPANALPATNEQLRIIGSVVGAFPTLPNNTRLSDGEFYFLVLARIARNNCKGDVPSMRAQLRRLFDPTNTGMDVIVQDVGGMHMVVQIGRALTADEKSVLAITSGVSQIPGGILPKPSGVTLTISEVDADGDVFNFCDVNQPDVLLLPGDAGFSDITGTLTGSWASLV